jgi:hypothetical protein
MNTSLFAHLALKIGSSPENLATEALGYVLRVSSGARAGVASLLRDLGYPQADEFRWETQVGGDDGSRPDLVGFDRAGQAVVFIEAKFWAGLTDRQPVAYLDRLPSNGALLFVAPDRRLGLLGAELNRRVLDAGRRLESNPGLPHGALTARVDGRYLGLLSWRTLLASARLGAEAARDLTAAADLAQLQGLCERMDAEAFIPITHEELTDHRFRRVLEFCDIVDSVTGALVEKKIASVKGLRATGGKGHYIRYMRLNDVVGASLLCDVRKWMKFGRTPLWLTVHGPAWKPSPEVEQLLASFGEEEPSRLFTTGDGYPTIAILVPAGQERLVVETRAFEQVAAVAQRLSGLVSTLPVDVSVNPEAMVAESS